MWEPRNTYSLKKSCVPLSCVRAITCSGFFAQSPVAPTALQVNSSGKLSVVNRSRIRSPEIDVVGLELCTKTVNASRATVNAVGCLRGGPPEMPTFRVPLKPRIKNLREPELASGAPQAPQPAPRPAPQPPKSVQVASAAAPEAPKPAAAAPAPAAPTIVGTWRVVEMAREGQTMPMPPGMNMMVTFTDSGTVSMAVSGGPGGGGV